MKNGKDDFIAEIDSKLDTTLVGNNNDLNDFKDWFKKRCILFSDNKLTKDEFNSSKFRKVPGECYWNSQHNFFVDNNYHYFEGLAYNTSIYDFTKHAFNVLNSESLKDFTFNSFIVDNYDASQKHEYCGVIVPKEYLDRYLENFFDSDLTKINNNIPLLYAYYLDEQALGEFIETI